MILYDYFHNRYCRKSRLGNKGVTEVKEHTFFKNETWNFKSIRDCVPPIVCELSGDDDTRNFDDVENDTPNENFPTPKAFAGNHLPFVGFTYSKDYQLLSQTLSAAISSDHQPSPRVRILIPHFRLLLQYYEKRSITIFCC